MASRRARRTASWSSSCPRQKRPGLGRLASRLIDAANQPTAKKARGVAADSRLPRFDLTRSSGCSKKANDELDSRRRLDWVLRRCGWSIRGARPEVGDRADPLGDVRGRGSLSDVPCLGAPAGWIARRTRRGLVLPCRDGDFLRKPLSACADRAALARSGNARWWPGIAGGMGPFGPTGKALNEGCSLEI